MCVAEKNYFLKTECIVFMDELTSLACSTTLQLTNPSTTLRYKTFYALVGNVSLYIGSDKREIDKIVIVSCVSKWSI